MAGGSVVQSTEVDSSSVIPVAGRAMKLAAAASAAWVVGGVLATAAAYVLYSHLVSIWALRQPESAVGPLAVGLGPALVIALIAAAVSAHTARLAHVRAQGPNSVSTVGRALALPDLARRLSVAALVVLALFTVLNSAWLFSQSLTAVAAREPAAAAWSQIAAAAVMTPFGLAAWWLLGRVDSTLRMSIGPDGHYWWDGEFWHPMAS